MKINAERMALKMHDTSGSWRLDIPIDFDKNGQKVPGVNDNFAANSIQNLKIFKFIY